MALLINDERVSDRVLDQELLHLSSGLEVDAPQAGGLHPEHSRARALRSVVARTLLLQVARKQKLQPTAAEVDAERRRRWGSEQNTFCGAEVSDALAEELLLERVRAHLTRHVPRPGRAEAEAFFQANKHLYRVAEAVQAAHIVRNVHTAEDERLAAEVLSQAEQELLRGTPFPRVADRYSDCKGVGGAVGWVSRGSMVQEFEDVVFALEPGRRSGVFRTVFGLHIATVTARRTAGMQAFDQVRQEISNRLFAERRSHTLAQAVARLEAESDIRFAAEEEQP